MKRISIIICVNTNKLICLVRELINKKATVNNCIRTWYAWHCNEYSQQLTWHVLSSMSNCNWNWNCLHLCLSVYLTVCLSYCLLVCPFHNCLNLVWHLFIKSAAGKALCRVAMSGFSDKQESALIEASAAVDVNQTSWLPHWLMAKQSQRIALSAFYKNI